LVCAHQVPLYPQPKARQTNGFAIAKRSKSKSLSNLRTKNPLAFIALLSAVLVKPLCVMGYDSTMDYLLSGRLRELLTQAEGVAQRIAPRADEVDQQAAWPEHAFTALKDTDLMGLNVPRRLGGEEQGMVGLVAITEILARACSSSAICYGMHCVGTAVIAAKATPDQDERYLRPIAEGCHITTLALSESGTGAHFYLPATQLRHDDGGFTVEGTKQFVTNGSKADSYVISVSTGEPDRDAGDFSCVVIDGATPGLQWLEPWRGVGMRGNSSRGLHLPGVRVPANNLLGEEGDQIWYVFEVVAPYFLMSMSATYLGIAEAALQATLQHVRGRRYAHSGEAVADVAAVQSSVAEMWAAVERTRGLIYHAAYLGDMGDPRALAAILSSKAEVADMAVWVTNEAMTLGGGIAYRENSYFARLLRDARASHVMSPTTSLLRQWLGRHLLGLPLL
jgi:isovaleryl-CoA dehydrogenase